MNLESLQEMWKKDSVIDTDLYCEESTKIPQLHMKYMEFFNTFSLMKKEREIEMRRLIREKWLYYKGKAPSSVYKELPFDLKLTTKEEINMFIESDEDICKLQYKIDYIEQLISFLEGVLRQIGNRNFQIKNAIEWEKFKNGF
jgi:hypothetical protein|tara:strand:+ start:1356 stop:1784 length:429 start_codon:yes stop_codon:yes gene_type:complete